MSHCETIEIWAIKSFPSTFLPIYGFLMIKMQRVMPVVMATVMSFLMSGIMTYMHLPEHGSFFSLWLHTWLFVWPCAIILASLVSPGAAKLAGKITDVLNKALQS